MGRRPFDAVFGMQPGLLANLVRRAANGSPAYPQALVLGGIDWDCQLPNLAVSHDGTGNNVAVNVTLPWSCQSYLMPWRRDDGMTTTISLGPNGVNNIVINGSPVQTVAMIMNNFTTNLAFRVGSTTENVVGTTLFQVTSTPLNTTVPVTPTNRIPQLLRLLRQSGTPDGLAAISAAGPSDIAVQRLLAAAQSRPPMLDDPQAGMVPVVAGMVQAINQQLVIPPILAPTGPNTSIPIPVANLVATADGPANGATGLAFRADLNLGVAGLPTPLPLAVDATVAPIAAPSVTLAGSLVYLSLGEELIENLVQAQIAQAAPIQLDQDGIKLSIVVGTPVALEIGAASAVLNVGVQVTITGTGSGSVVVGGTLAISLQLAVQPNQGVTVVLVVTPASFSSLIAQAIDQVDPFGPNSLWAALVSLLAKDVLPTINQQLAASVAPQLANALNQTLASIGPTVRIPPQAGFAPVGVGFDAGGWITFRFAATNPAALQTPQRIPRLGALNSAAIAIETTFQKGEPLQSTKTNLQIVKITGPQICADGSPGQQAIVEQARLRLAAGVDASLVDPIMNPSVATAFGAATAPAQAQYPTLAVATRTAGIAIASAPNATPVAPVSSTNTTLSFETSALQAPFQPMVDAIEAASGKARVAALMDAIAGGSATLVVQSMLRNNLHTLLSNANVQLATLADVGSLAKSNALLAPGWSTLASDLAAAFETTTIASIALGSAGLQLTSLNLLFVGMVLCDGKPASATLQPTAPISKGQIGAPVWRVDRIERVHLHRPPPPHPLPKLHDPERW